MGKGVFIISLDFELAWGLDGKPLTPAFREKVIWEIQKGIPETLKLFKEYKIHATWATVGGIFSESKKKDALFYNPSLVKLILSYHNQEIGTHTFTHFCSLMKNQNKNDFLVDLKLAKKYSKENGIKIESIVFPHNQVNEEYLLLCQEEGITSYRGNEKSRIYRSKEGGREPLFYRFVRLVDSYVNITGNNTFDLKKSGGELLNIPSSRFLRPYNKFLWLFESLKFNRISVGMEYAAKNNLVYHLWWHPFNLGAGKEFEKNLKFLEKILIRFSDLSIRYGMESLNMRELTNKIIQND